MNKHVNVGSDDEREEASLQMLRLPSMAPSRDLGGFFVALVASYVATVALFAAVGRQFHRRWSFLIAVFATVLTLSMLWLRLIEVTLVDYGTTRDHYSTSSLAKDEGTVSGTSGDVDSLEDSGK